MNRYVLNLMNFGGWSEEASFGTLAAAVSHGQTHFQQNTWHVVDRRTNQVRHEHDGSEGIEAEARLDQRRIQTTAHWRRFFAERSQQSERNRMNLSAIAAHQREEAARSVVLRQARLRGFNFVGARPSVEDWAVVLLFEPKSLNRVNWKGEGF